MLRVALRVDATAELGWGHLKRCMALAAALQEVGAELAFCGRAASPAVALQLQVHAWPWLEMPPARAGDGEAADAQALAAALPWPVDLLVVDHYGLGAAWHHAARAATGARILAIDDLANRPLAPDLLVDPNPSADHAQKYSHVLPVGVPLCGGPSWALLDPVYTNRPVQPLEREVQRLGIFMGGSDPHNHSCWVLGLIRGDLRWQGEVHVATTSSNPHLAMLLQWAAKLGAQVHLDLPHLADFHGLCDLQVGAGGGALWERCRLGVPTLALICADNQCQTVPALAQAGVVCGQDARGQTAEQAQSLVAALGNLLADPGQRRALQQRAMALVDGRGAQRLSQRALALLKPSSGLSLRPATLEDAPLLLAWRNDDATRNASHHSEPISLNEHVAWLQRSLADPRRRLWVACQGPLPVGTVRADWDTEPGSDSCMAPITEPVANAGVQPGVQPGMRPGMQRCTTHGTYTLSWTVSPAARGGGIGRAMVALAALELPGRLRAQVKRGNVASARIAQAAGLAPAGQDGDTLLFERG